jgi:restriction system protein
MTITDAIRQVLTKASKPLTPGQIHQAIVDGQLFHFNSKAGPSIVRTQLRRHCEGVEAQSASSKKYFRAIGNSHYALL